MLGYQVNILFHEQRLHADHHLNDTNAHKTFQTIATLGKPLDLALDACMCICSASMASSHLQFSAQPNAHSWPLHKRWPQLSHFNAILGLAANKSNGRNAPEPTLRMSSYCQEIQQPTCSGKTAQGQSPCHHASCPLESIVLVPEPQGLFGVYTASQGLFFKRAFQNVLVIA